MRCVIGPSCRASLVAISSAALFVNVNAQIPEGAIPSCSMRKRMRSMRQNVLPAPGPARTSVAPGGASMAAR